VHPQISFLLCGYNSVDAYMHMHVEHYAEHSKQRKRKRGGRKKFLEKSIQFNKDTTAIICVGEPFTV
jgi:hypothetical protein